MHIVHLIERRFGSRAGGVTAVLVALSLSGIALGLGLLFTR
jgi:hypothetical protein